VVLGGVVATQVAGVHKSRAMHKSPTVDVRAAQTGVYFFFDVYGFKASFGCKRLTDIDRRPVRNSYIQVKNACLSGPIRRGWSPILFRCLRYRSQSINLPTFQCLRLRTHILPNSATPETSFTNFSPEAYHVRRLNLMAFK
jgi:hypothetical protein